uniref:Uncharacterized protein n=1 Tax=Oryza punctata TaxID=4537 RepID=A0A0E0K000_ORYPU
MAADPACSAMASEGQDVGDDAGMVLLRDGSDGLPALKVDRETYRGILLKFYMACCIRDFKHDIRELVEAYLKPWHELEQDWTRQVSADRAAVMEQLLFLGLDATEPPEPQQQQLLQEEEENGGGGGEKDPPVSSAGFLDRLQMRRMIQAFFHPDLVDVEDEGKDTRSDRNLIGNFMAATGFVNRLWDARRIIAVCRDSNMDDAARKATAAGMLRRLEELLNDGSDGLPDLKVDRETHRGVLLKFYMACCISDFKHDIRELVEAYFEALA